MQPLEPDTSSIQVPGLDVSLPPLATNLGDALQHFGTETPPPPLIPSTPSVSPPSRESTPSMSSAPKIAKRITTKRRRVTYWTRHELTTLLHGLAMAGARLDKLASVVPTRSAENCRKQLRAIAERIRALNTTTATHQLDTAIVLSKEQCASIILTHHALSMPKASPPESLSQWRSLGAKHKLAVQVVPHTEADATPIRALDHNPCVEVLLRASRSVWDVLCHLYSKWGYPIQLLAPNGTVLDIAENVLQVVRQHGAQREGNVVRLQFSLLKLQVDWSVMSQSARTNSAVTSSRTLRKRVPHANNRTYAPLVPTKPKICYPFGSPPKSNATDSAEPSDCSSAQRAAVATSKDNVSLITLPASGVAHEANDVRMTQKEASPSGQQAVMERLKGHLASLSEQGAQQPSAEGQAEAHKPVDMFGESLNAEFLKCVQDADICAFPRLTDSLFETPLLERSKGIGEAELSSFVKQTQHNFLLQDNALDGSGFAVACDNSPDADLRKCQATPETRTRPTPIKSAMFSDIMSPNLGITSQGLD